MWTTMHTSEGLELDFSLDLCFWFAHNMHGWGKGILLQVTMGTHLSPNIRCISMYCWFSLSYFLLPGNSLSSSSFVLVRYIIIFGDLIVGAINVLVAINEPYVHTPKSPKSKLLYPQLLSRLWNRHITLPQIGKLILFLIPIQYREILLIKRTQQTDPK